MKKAFLKIIKLIRYRFFLFAGAFPYFLGASLAIYNGFPFNLSIFLLGLLGMIFAFGGVEFFNEYFEPESGLFSQKTTYPDLLKLLGGIICFAFALFIGVFLTLKIGLLVIILALLGFLIALFYVGPPLRLIYRGLGEVAIFLAYGPLMVLGSYYIQGMSVDGVAILASLIPGNLILSLAILNEIPDYYLDMIRGKRNMVVRVGRRRGALLFATTLLLSYLLIIVEAMLRILPTLSLFSLLSLPIALRGTLFTFKHYDEAERLGLSVNNTALSYIAVNGMIILSLILAKI